MKEVTIFLTPIEAERYKQFLQHYSTFNFLLEKKVFEQKGATITLHFDYKGDIGSITRADVLYLSNKKFDNLNEKVV